MTPSITINAHSILALLAARHTNDVFVAECKNGPTHDTRGLLKMDAWAMAKSWARPVSIGYEIKVSRSDFMRDNKWKRYLDYCTDFYFVISPGVCELSELPEGVGLLVASKNCKRLTCKRKAISRDVEVPEELYRYVLMCRTKVKDEYDRYEVKDKRVTCQQWLDDKEDRESLGGMVSHELAIRFQKMKSRVLRAEAEAARFEPIKQMLADAGIDDDWRLKIRINEVIRGVIPKDLRNQIGNCSKRLAVLVKEIDEQEVVV